MNQINNNFLYGNRICEYCGTPMDLIIDEDGFLVFDCPNCMNTYTVEGENYV